MTIDWRIRGGAKFNRDRTRRRLLWRYWGSSPDRAFCCFICLNPSTADEKKNDHSVTKMIGFAERLHCRGLMVVNLFDLKTTYPSVLYESPWPNSNANNRQIIAAANSAKIVICAWGTHGLLHNRGVAVLELLRRNGLRRKLRALKINSDGTPAHPLRLPYSLRPIPYGESHDR